MALRSRVEDIRNMCEVIRLKDSAMVQHTPGGGMGGELQHFFVDEYARTQSCRNATGRSAYARTYDGRYVICHEPHKLVFQS